MRLTCVFVVIALAGAAGVASACDVVVKRSIFKDRDGDGLCEKNAVKGTDPTPGDEFEVILRDASGHVVATRRATANSRGRWRASFDVDVAGGRYVAEACDGRGVGGACDGPEASIVGIGMAYDGADSLDPAKILFLYSHTNEEVIEAGDVILEYRGIPVANGRELDAVIEELPDVAPGDFVHMLVQKVNGGREPVDVTAIADAIPGSTAGETPRELEFADRICTDGGSYCYCAGRAVHVCTLQTWYKIEENKKKTAVRSACTDSGGNDCDEDLTKQGK